MAIGADAVARVEVDDAAVRVVPVGLAKLWAMKTSVRIPVLRIRSVDLFFDDYDELRGKPKIGRFHSKDTRAFLVVGTGRPVVVIECSGGAYDRVVFSAADPEAVVRDVGRVVGSHLP
ncbi:MAG TPA: hypothetical protein VHD87_13975 [Acidimicrobiales bacterium]|nr:hypothetical protein [Acidimicrobiales bacterium]